MNWATLNRALNGQNITIVSKLIGEGRLGKGGGRKVTVEAKKCYDMTWTNDDDEQFKFDGASICFSMLFLGEKKL